MFDNTIIFFFSKGDHVTVRWIFFIVVCGISYELII